MLRELDFLRKFVWSWLLFDRASVLTKLFSCLLWWAVEPVPAKDLWRKILMLSRMNYSSFWQERAQKAKCKEQQVQTPGERFICSSTLRFDLFNSLFLYISVLSMYFMIKWFWIYSPKHLEPMSQYSVWVCCRCSDVCVLVCTCAIIRLQQYGLLLIVSVYLIWSLLEEGGRKQACSGFFFFITHHINISNSDPVLFITAHIHILW